MRIWKWEFQATNMQIIEMPKGAKILDVQIQRNSCCMWALCDENAEKETRKLAIYETGSPLPENPGNYIATFQANGGYLVFHVFELNEHP